MLLRRAGLIAAVLALSTSAHAADAGPPPFVYLAELIGKGKSDYQLGAGDLATKTFTVRYPALPYGLTLAVHATTRRFALSFQGLAGTPVPTIDGHTLEVPDGHTVLFVGDLDHGVTAAIPGDQKCVSAKCFEKAARFSADGARLFTDVLTSSYSLMRAYALADKPWSWALIDKRKTKRGVGPFAFSPDVARIAYQASDGFYVETLPAPPKDAKSKPAALKQSKRIAPLALLGGYPLLLTEKEIVYFGREPKEQIEGYVEVIDIASKKVVRVYTFPYDYPEWHDGFLYSAARRTVVFRTGDSSGVGPLMALTLDDGKVTKLLDGVDYVFDVSPDGRYVLIGVRVDEKDAPGWKGRPFAFAAFDLSTGKVSAQAPLPATAGYSVYEHPQAFFFAPATN